MSVPVPPPRLHQKVALVTGSSSGVGRAICLAFAAAGTSLLICADLRPTCHGAFGADEPNVPTHELINKRFGEGKAVYVKMDVTEPESVENAVKLAAEKGGRLDVMVNNAGTGGTESAGKCHEMKQDTWDFTMKMNATSVFLGCRAAIAQFLSQPPHSSFGGHRGWIINTASMLGLVGLKPGAAAYCASKGACVLLTKQIAVEYAGERIHCNCSRHPFLMKIGADLKTPMTHGIYEKKSLREGINDMTPWNEWGNPEDVARCAVFLASEDAAYVTGVALPIDGGYTAM